MWRLTWCHQWLLVLTQPFLTNTGAQCSWHFEKPLWLLKNCTLAVFLCPITVFGIGALGTNFLRSFRDFISNCTAISEEPIGMDFAGCLTVAVILESSYLEIITFLLSISTRQWYTGNLSKGTRGGYGHGASCSGNKISSVVKGDHLRKRKFVVHTVKLWAMAWYNHRNSVRPLFFYAMQFDHVNLNCCMFNSLLLYLMIFDVT